MKDEKKNAKGRFKRENKNRPREISSKKKIPKLRQVIEVHRKVCVHTCNLLHVFINGLMFHQHTFNFYHSKS